MWFDYWNPRFLLGHPLWGMNWNTCHWKRFLTTEILAFIVCLLSIYTYIITIFILLPHDMIYHNNDCTHMITKDLFSRQNVVSCHLATEITKWHLLCWLNVFDLLGGFFSIDIDGCLTHFMHVILWIFCALDCDTTRSWSQPEKEPNFAWTLVDMPHQ